MSGAGAGTMDSFPQTLYNQVTGYALDQGAFQTDGVEYSQDK